MNGQNGINTARTERSIRLAMAQVFDATAKKVLEETNDTLSKTSWDKVLTSSIFDSKKEENAGKPVRIVGTISSITDPSPYQLDDDERITVCGITLRDKFGEEIECLKFSLDQFPNIYTYFENHRTSVFCGSIVSIIDANGSSYKFVLNKITDKVTAEDLIILRKEGGDRIAEIFKQHSRTAGGIVKYIKSVLVNELHIKGLDQAKHLDKCIDFMIYQSLSAGSDQTKSMKLHSLVIGAPGVGKKLLTITAKVLNPVFEEIAGLDGKVTLAGLIGDVRSKDGRKYSNPGYFALASSGVVSIQDFHTVSGNDRRRVLGAFSKVMEDGEVIDSTSARFTHEAVTSIHLDMNRLSQVNKGKKYDPFSDIEIPSNIISRFDFIMDIPRDADRQTEVAYAINTGTSILNTYGRPTQEPQWERDLKRIIAYIRTYWYQVEIDSSLNRYINSKIKEIADANDNPTDTFTDSITRLAISVGKYVKAITGANLRNKATIEDVDLAFYFIKEKLKFLSTVEHVIVPELLSRKERRLKFISGNFKGSTFTAKEVLESVQSKFDSNAAIATVYRDLAEIAEKRGQGSYYIS